MLRAADALDGAVRGLCRVVVVVVGLTLMLTLGANVLARYLFASGGFDWAQEVPERLFPWFIMAGAALAVQQGGHIAVEWALEKLGRAGRRWLLVAGQLLVLAAYVKLSFLALEVAEIASIERSPALGLSGAHGHWAIAAGCVLIVIGTVTNTLRVAMLGPEAMPQPSPEVAAT